jgi:hypothetical protein
MHTKVLLGSEPETGKGTFLLGFGLPFFKEVFEFDEGLLHFYDGAGAVDELDGEWGTRL